MIERLQTPYALINVDIQKGFLPKGDLPVPDGDQIVPVVNKVNRVGRRAGALVVFTRDRHPLVTTHFQEYGGNWPPHCIEDTKGYEFSDGLEIDSDNDVLVSKGMGADEDAYSGFEARTDQGEMLDLLLRSRGVKRVIIGGLALDYCDKATALDSVRLGYETYVMEDAVKAVNINPGDDERAWREMLDAGVKRINSDEAVRELLSMDSLLAGQEVSEWLKSQREGKEMDFLKGHPLLG